MHHHGNFWSERAENEVVHGLDNRIDIRWMDGCGLAPRETNHLLGQVSGTLGRFPNGLNPRKHFRIPLELPL